MPTFSAFCAATYAPHAELRLKASTWDKRTYLLATLYNTFGDMRLGQIDAAAVDAYATSRLREGVGAVSVNNELRVLKRVLRFARDERGMPIPKPSWKLLPERGKRRVHAWSGEESARFLRACAEHSPDILGLMVFLLNTGCRKGEAIALTWENVNTARGHVQIWPGNGWSPKNEQPREVPISDALAPWLSDDRRRGKWVFPTPEGERYALLPRRGFSRARRLSGAYECARCKTGRPVVPTGQRRLAKWAKVCECGSKRWRILAPPVKGGPHTLRHTFATAFLAGNPDLFLLGKIMGHSHERVTELYAHLLPDHLARARNVVSLSVGAPPPLKRKR